MPFREVDLEPFTLGLYVPDSNNETPAGSLTHATNVILSEGGGIRQRPGIGAAATTYANYGYSFLHKPSTFVYLKTDGTGNIFTAGVTTLSSGSSLTGGPTNASGHAQMQVNPSTPGTVNTYIAQYNAELVKFNGTTFTSLTAGTSPKCRYLTSGMASERLWAAGFDAGTNLAGTTVGPSTVAWSDPVSPESWPTSNWQNFGVDNKPITGIASFSGQIFVFKDDRFWVIYSLTVSGGATTANYREVTGAGLIQPGAYCVTEVGIFFMGKDGVYLTDGTTPVKVSVPIDGIFNGNLPAWTSYNRLLPLPTKSVQTMAVSDGIVYMVAGNQSSGGSQGSCVLTYDYRNKAWTYFDLGDYLPISLTEMPWGDITRPLIAGVAKNGTDYLPINFHPFLKVDGTTDFIEVEVAMNWRQIPTGLGYVAMDTVHVQRLDVWGLGHSQVGVAYDFEASPWTWADLPLSEIADADVWGDGSDPSDVWGDGSDPSDVWGGSVSAATDLLRLQPPDHKFVYNLSGRGRYLSLHFRKLSDATYFYLERPRLTVITRG